MRFSRFSMLPLCVSAVGIHATSFAWWDQGHQLVGQLASEAVTPTTHEKVLALLQVPVAVPGTVELSKNTSGFDTAGSWADSVKMYNNSPATKDTSECHYLDLEMDNSMIGSVVSDEDAQKALSKALVKHPVNSITCLKGAIKTLLDSKQTLEDQAIATRFIIHLVGDMAQPLHNVEFMDNGKGDRGGNNTVFPVTIYIPTTNGHGSPQTKLHAVWDGTLGVFLQFPYNSEQMKNGLFSKSDLELNKYFANTLKDQPFTQDLFRTTQASHQSIENWVMDSYKIAVKNIYSDLNLSWGVYSAPRYPLVTTQIVKGSVQLALLLDALFDPSNASLEFQTMVYAIKNDRSVKPFLLH